MSEEYFSDREQGPRARESEEISAPAWGGIVAVIRALVNSGAFGDEFPEECPDGPAIIGTDEGGLGLAVQAEIPDLSWPPDESAPPPTIPVLDLLEFVHRIVAEPRQRQFHSYFQHYHLGFDRGSGQRTFRDKVNRILARNGIAFHLSDAGRIERLVAPGLREALQTAEFRTGDDRLDGLLGVARLKFLSPDPLVRREALEKLWDAWERLKTLEEAKSKRESVATLLDGAAVDTAWRERLEREAKELTDIGNAFHIRHSETTQNPLRNDHDVDYLFHRLFALIQLLLRSRGAV